MVYTPQRTLPDVEKVATDALVAGTVLAFADYPDNLYTRCASQPVVIVTRAGGRTPTFAHVDVANIQIQCYGASREIAADAAETCRIVFANAARAGTVFNGGYINWARVITPAFRLIDAALPSRVWRYDAIHQLGIRPHA